MAIVDLTDMAKYGLSLQWAQAITNQVVTTRQTFSVPTYVTIPALDPGVLNQITTKSTQDVGFYNGSLLSLQDFSIYGYNIFPNSAITPTIAKDFHYIVNYNTSADPISITKIDDVFVGPTWSPGDQEAYHPTYKLVSPVETYLDVSAFTPDEITYTSLNESGAGEIAPGKITLTQQGLDASAGSTYTFKFTPGDESTASLTYTASNTAGYTTTNGTTNSSSNTQTASMTVGESIELSEGLAGIASSKETFSLQEGWSGAWTNLKSVNFSKSSDEQSTTGQTETIKVEPGTTAKNSKGTYLYTQQVNQPDGSTTTASTGFVPGLWYTANMTKTQTTVQNNITGNYDIGGSVGTISDSSKSKHSVSASASQALELAAAGGYRDLVAAAWGFDTFGELSASYRGTAAGSTVVESAWTVSYTEDASMNSSASTSGSAASSRKLEKSQRHIKLKNFDTTLLDQLGVSYDFDQKSNGKKKVRGTGFTDVVKGSRKGNHHFSKFISSFLYGHVNNDVFRFGPNASDNSIFASDGDDKVISSASQTADLGSGNDSYKISADAEKNSFHQILTGLGEDTLIVNSSDASFRIADFNPFLDTVKVGDNLDSDLLTGKLVPFAKGNRILDNASIKFFYDGNQIGTAYFSTDADFIQAMADPSVHREVAFLNSKNYKSLYKTPYSAFQIFSDLVSDSTGYSRPVTSGDWPSLDNKQRVNILNNSFEAINTQFPSDAVTDLVQNAASKNNLSSDIFS